METKTIETRALLKAVREQKPDLLDILLQTNPSRDQYYYRSLQTAIKDNNSQMLKAFIKNGFKPSENAYCAFNWCIQFKREDLHLMLSKIEKPIARFKYKTNSFTL